MSFSGVVVNVEIRRFFVGSTQRKTLQRHDCADDQTAKNLVHVAHALARPHRVLQGLSAQVPQVSGIAGARRRGPTSTSAGRLTSCRMHRVVVEVSACPCLRSVAAAPAMEIPTVQPTRAGRKTHRLTEQRPIFFERRKPCASGPSREMIDGLEPHVESC